MPVHWHVEQEEQEGAGVAQSAGETASRGPNSLPASRRDHQEDRARLFTALHSRKVRNNHRIIESFRLEKTFKIIESNC